MTKTVYRLDTAGVYVGPIEADESPLEPGVFLIPAGAVETPPPAPPVGSVARWSGGAWAIVADHRGEAWYLDGQPTVITTVGDPVAAGYSSTPPLPTLEDLRAAKIAAILVATGEDLAHGAPVAGGLHVALDDGSRSDLTALASTATAVMISNGAIAWPDSYARGWITVENERVPLATPSEGLAFAAAVGGYYSAIVQHRRDLKDAALAATSAAELDAIMV